MEVLSLAATLTQLVEGALVVSKTSRNVFTSYQSAPKAVESIKNHNQLFRNILDEAATVHHRLRTEDALEQLPLHAQVIIEAAVEETYSALNDLGTSLESAGDQASIRQRVKFAILNRHILEKSQKRLEVSKITLIIALQLLGLQFSKKSQALLSNISVSQQQLQCQTVEENTVFRQARKISCAEQFESPREINSNGHHDPTYPWLDTYVVDKDCPSTLRMISWGNNTILTPSARSGSVSVLRNSNVSNYALSVRAKLPWFSSYKAINLELRLRHYALAWSNVSLTCGYIALSGYISRKAPVVKACEVGDEATVRKILYARQAGPNDYFTASDLDDAWPLDNNLLRGDYSLLAMAITSGNISLVQYLINVGANVNLTVGIGARSPLQIAAHLGRIHIIRLLINERASLDHLDTFGNNIGHTIFLRGILSRKVDQNDSDTLMKILLAAGFTEFRQLNRLGGSILSFAIRNASMSVVDLLIRQGEEISSSVCQAAALGGRLDLLPLLRKYGGDIDSSKETLLSAAAGGDATTIQYLISRGADVNQAGGSRVAPPYLRNMPQALVHDFAALAMNSSLSIVIYDELRPLDMLIISHLPIFERECLRRFQDCLAVLLQHAAEPWPTVSVPLSLYRDVGWWHGQQGFLRYEELFQDLPSMSATYFYAIHRVYSEIIVDDEGDIFWDATVDIDGPSHGSSYLTPERGHKVDSTCLSCQVKKHMSCCTSL